MKASRGLIVVIILALGTAVGAEGGKVEDVRWGMSAGVGISAGVAGAQGARLVDITRESRYNKATSFLEIDGQQGNFVAAGRYGYATNFGIFQTEPEMEHQVSGLIGLAAAPGVLNVSLLTGVGFAAGRYHDLASGRRIDYASPAFPLELNLSLLVWGWGLGAQYHGEMNPQFTSTSFLVVLRHQN